MAFTGKSQQRRIIVIIIYMLKLRMSHNWTLGTNATTSFFMKNILAEYFKYILSEYNFLFLNLTKHIVFTLHALGPDRFLF